MVSKITKVAPIRDIARGLVQINRAEKHIGLVQRPFVLQRHAHLCPVDVELAQVIAVGVADLLVLRSDEFPTGGILIDETDESLAGGV